MYSGQLGNKTATRSFGPTPRSERPFPTRLTRSRRSAKVIFSFFHMKAGLRGSFFADLSRLSASVVCSSRFIVGFKVPPFLCLPYGFFGPGNPLMICVPAGGTKVKRLSLRPVLIFSFLKLRVVVLEKISWRTIRSTRKVWGFTSIRI